MKILVADDEPNFLEIMNTFLSARGHEVHSALDGEKARELTVRNRYDAAFLDFTMPGLTGLELVEHVRAHSPAAKTYIITAYAGIEDSFVKALGLDGLLFKPLSFEQLGKLLETF